MERQLEPALRSKNGAPLAPTGGRDPRRAIPDFAAFRHPETEPEEALIVDARSHCRPAQMVERKLVSVLGRGVVPASHMRTTALLAGRSRG